MTDAPILYFLFFLLPILASVGFPFPEEITIISAGYLSYLGITNFWAAWASLGLGIVAGDILAYALGRFWGDWLWQNIFARSRLAGALLAKAKKLFEKYGEKIVALSRPIMSVRTVVPILMGHFKMDFKKFLFYDVPAGFLWAIFLSSLSFYLGSGLDLITEVREIKFFVFAAIIVLILIYAAVKAMREKYRES